METMAERGGKLPFAAECANDRDAHIGNMPLGECEPFS